VTLLIGKKMRVTTYAFVAFVAPILMLLVPALLEAHDEHSWVGDRSKVYLGKEDQVVSCQDLVH
jgi:hypothetical protein